MSPLTVSPPGQWGTSTRLKTVLLGCLENERASCKSPIFSIPPLPALPVVLKEKNGPTDNKMLHSGALLKRSVVFQSLPSLFFLPADGVCGSIVKARRPLRGRFDDGLSLLNTVLRSTWKAPRFLTDNLMSERQQANGTTSNWYGLIYGLTQRCSANLSFFYSFLTSEQKVILSCRGNRAVYAMSR